MVEGASVEIVGDLKIFVVIIGVAGSGITEIVELIISVEVAGDCELFSIAVNGSGMTVTVEMRGEDGSGMTVTVEMRGEDGSGMTVTVEIRGELLKVDAWSEPADTLADPNVKEVEPNIAGSVDDPVIAGLEAADFPKVPSVPLPLAALVDVCSQTAVGFTRLPCRDTICSGSASQAFSSRGAGAAPTHNLNFAC